MNFRCIHCGGELHSPGDAVGVNVTCPMCRSSFIVRPEYIELRPASKKAGRDYSILAVVLVLAAFSLPIVLSAVTSPKTSSRMLNPPEVLLKWDDTHMGMVNMGVTATGTVLTIILNSPYDGFETACKVPAVGEFVIIPLNSFVKRNGDRFMPYHTAVLEAWVGGSGYDYRQFR